MEGTTSDLAHRLAQNAETVCRDYLCNGRREGRYWLVGDARNTPGRSLYVRLNGYRVSKLTDGATAEHDDLLDIIRETCRLTDFHNVAAEARRFLSLLRPTSEPRRPHLLPAPAGSPESARRLFAISQSITGTVAETYLRNRRLPAPAPQRTRI